MSIDWPEPWRPIASSKAGIALEAELRRELAGGHPLFGMPAIAIARRQDQDDVLFALPDGRVAEVHLTWRGQPEPDPRWPYTTIYQSVASWAQQR